MRGERKKKKKKKKKVLRTWSRDCGMVSDLFRCQEDVKPCGGRIHACDSIKRDFVCLLKMLSCCFFLHLQKGMIFCSLFELVVSLISRRFLFDFAEILLAYGFRSFPCQEDVKPCGGRFHVRDTIEKDRACFQECCLLLLQTGMKFLLSFGWL